MPRLRKQSLEQRSQTQRQTLRNYRERNSQSDRTRNSQTLATLRQNEEYRENERESDRLSRATRRLYSSATTSEQMRNSQQHVRRRTDPIQRSVEQIRNTLEHSQRRENLIERGMEQIRNTQQHSRRRQDPNLRSIEQSRNTQEHSQRRQNPVQRAIEQERNTIEHSQRRENPIERAIEQMRNTQQHIRRRTDPIQRSVEQIRNTLEHSQRRENLIERGMEQIRNTQQHFRRRQDPNLRSIEQSRNTQEHSQRRQNPVQRAIEQERNTMEHSQRRENPIERAIEQSRNTQEHSRRRQNPTQRNIEQERNTRDHSMYRQNPDYQQVERERNTASHSVRRSNPIYRDLEQTRNTSQRREARQQARNRVHDVNRMMDIRIRIHRLNPHNRERENSRQTERNRQNRRNLSPDSRQQFLLTDSQRHTDHMLSEFNQCVKNGPTEICVCCGGLWFPNQIKNLNKIAILNQFPHLTEVFFLSEIFTSENNIYKFCNTCHKIVKGGRVPTICLSKGLHFPTIPDELKGLTALEERFVAPRIPFMRIVSLGYNRQCAIRGAVVNVPISLSRTVDVLPRRFDETEVIQVHLKRKLEYNHSFMTETIRPRKIYEAARYLVNTDLYRSHNIVISEDWLNSVESTEEVPFVSNQNDQELVRRMLSENSEEDIVNETNPQETLVENNPVENLPLEKISIAPGEGQRPLDLLFDEDSEELSFPSIYCGVKKTISTTIGKAIKSKARRFDRRCARVDVVLYSYRKLELSRIKSSISTCLRKKIGGNTYLVGQVLDDNFVRNLIQHDEGYHILKGIRSSPAHWEGEKKKVLAMIRQFGLPTFFITLSAAESQWPELLIILAKVLENKDITEDEARSYTTQEKYNLIRQDPITCSRYFDQRIRHLFKHFKANAGIFGEHNVVKHYWRIEFQQRGSPHVHGIYWLKNAPLFNINNHSSFPEVIRFIDRFVSTDSEIEMVQNYISYQEHNHSRSCQREIRGRQFCRFRIPYPPMPSTKILLPLPEDTDGDDLKKYQENFENIHTFLNAKLSNEEVDQVGSFEQFLSNERINLSHEEYILALRSSLKKPQIFLKRSFKNRSINAFNPNILAMQRSNMDIQFIMDAYACVSYIINYINKSNRGVSRLLQEAMDEIRTGNFNVKERLKHIGNKFISASEVSAQEASYNILGMHLSQCSNAEVFINTFRPEKRVRMLKSRQELENMPSTSTDVFRSNLLDHYVNRPDTLSHVCLAKFAAYYSFSKKKRSQRRNQHEEQEDDYVEDNDFDTGDNDTAYSLRNNVGFVYERRTPAIIRFPSFGAEVSRGDYFRSIAMLYLPWRDEQEELLEDDNEQICSRFKDIIEANRLEFEMFKEGELEEILQQVREENEIDDNEEDNIAATQVLDDEFRALAIPDVDPNTNVLNIPAHDGTTDETNDGIRLIRLPVLITEWDLLSSIRGLNAKQRVYLQHLLQNVVENKKFYEFVGGGAGVGKSRLIKTVYHSITQRFNSVPGSNHELQKVLLSAPTGKAAFSIGGSTLHALFSLPINQYSGEIRPLSNDVINSLVANFIELKLIIIDEISMVGSRMLGYLDSRLKQIFKSTEPFGGISVLVFGDLKQLPPVGDKWIFKPNSANPYGVIAGEGLWDLFNFYELTDIMRQREDLSFAHALNNMAVGQMTEENIRIIESRVVNSNSDVPADAIHLFVSNAEAEDYNKSRLRQISTEEFTSNSSDVIKSDSSSVEQRRQILASAGFRNLKTSETQGLCSSLILKMSAKYMMTVNINTSDGLVNGASGVLMGIELQRNSRCPKTLWVLFGDENVGVETRRKKPHPTESFWTPIEKCTRSFQFKKNMQITIERKQFPLIIAEGITIHKSQGATYSKVAVHARGRIQRSSLYVACSRATSASGLYIIGNFNPPNPFEELDPVKLELDRLRSQKSIPIQHHLINSPEYNSKLFYQNIQSLRAHYEDITSDPLISNVDIVCFVETWTRPTEEYVIPNFSTLSRLDSMETQTSADTSRSRKGMVIYVNNGILSQTEFLFKRDHRHGNHNFQYIVMRCIEHFYLILYKNIDFPVTIFQTLLIRAINEIKTRSRSNNAKIIVIGDFNLCRKTVDQHTEIILNQNGFSSLLDKTSSTTNHGTHIDWAFSNISNEIIFAKVYATIHSHHDGIVVAIKN